jgi:hypothetical protein
MKKLILLFLLSSTAVLAKSDNFKEASGWSFSAGRGTLVDGKKKTSDLEPSGTTFKGSWTHRTKYFDTGLMARYGKFTDEVTYNNIQGDFSHGDLTLGFMASFWAFSWFNVHGGYTFHRISEKVRGNYTDQEETEIQKKYNLIDQGVYGLYGGADLVLLQSKSFQFFVNYDYYHLNGFKAHQWEAMAGFKFYLAPSKVGKGNFFVKMFTEMFAPKNN